MANTSNSCLDMSGQDSSDSEEFESPETLPLSVISSNDDLESISVPSRTGSPEPLDLWLRAWNPAGSQEPTISLLPAPYRAALEAEDRRFRDLMAQVGTDPSAGPDSEVGRRSGRSTDGQQRGRTPAHESLHFSEADFVNYDPEACSHSADPSTSTDSSTTTETDSDAGSLRRSHSHDMLASRGLAWRLRTWRGSGGPRDHPLLFNNPALAMPEPGHAPPYPRHARITITSDHGETDRSISVDRRPSPVRQPSDDSDDSGSSSSTASSRSLSPPRHVYHPRLR